MSVTWDSSDGNWNFFLDGVHRSNIEGFSTGKSVPAGGVLVVGQDQDSLGGRFETKQSFTGWLSRLNVWDKILPLDVVVSLATEPGNENGNVVPWRDLRKHLVGPVEVSSPSIVHSNVGSSNYQLTFPTYDLLNHARLDFDGEKVGKLTICTWISLASYEDPYEPTLLSYKSAENNDIFILGFKDDVHIIFGSTLYNLGGLLWFKSKNWHLVCVAWDGETGSTYTYVDGTLRGSKTLVGKGMQLLGKGVWIFGNRQGLQKERFKHQQAIRNSVAQVNVWDYILPQKAVRGLSYGGTSAEGNYLRWSNIIANLAVGGSYRIETFSLYLPNALVHKKRDEYCNVVHTKNAGCPSGPLYARVGLTHNDDTKGMEWRCYCKSTLASDKNAYNMSSRYYVTDIQLKDLYV